MGLQVCKAHLDSFPQVARLEKRLGLHLAPRHVAGILVEVAHNASCCHARAAVGLQWARATVGHCGAISDTLSAATRPVVVSVLPAGQIQRLRRLSKVKSKREKAPSLRLLMSHTGMCGVIVFFTSQPRKRPVPSAPPSSVPLSLSFSACACLLASAS